MACSCKINFFLLAKIFLYFVSVLCGFAVVVTVGVTMANFNQQCLLYADVTRTGGGRARVTFTNTSRCSFSIYLCSFLAIVYALLLLVYHVYGLIKRDPTNGTNMLATFITMINVLVTIAFFVSACIISVGFKTFCDRYVKARSHSCKSAEYVTWIDSNVDSTTFYEYLKAAEIACWVLFLDWLAQVGVDVGRTLLNRRRQSQADDSTINVASVEPTA